MVVDDVKRCADGGSDGDQLEDVSAVAIFETRGAIMAAASGESGRVDLTCGDTSLTCSDGRFPAGPSGLAFDAGEHLFSSTRALAGDRQKRI
jgi:hypothetical protein